MDGTGAIGPDQLGKLFTYRGEVFEQAATPDDEVLANLVNVAD